MEKNLDGSDAINKSAVRINEYTVWKNRKQWFIDRIGKRIYRCQVKCQCDSCRQVHEEGLIIIDVDHAIYLHCAEAEMGIRYSEIKYHH